MTTKTNTPQKCYEITLPKGVEAAWVTMAGKLYYLDDTTGEAIAEGGIQAPATNLTSIPFGWSDKEQKWVYVLCWDNGETDRVDYDGAIPNMPTRTDLQAAVVSVAWEHGLEIREDQVTVDNGNIYANWISECTTQN